MNPDSTSVSETRRALFDAIAPWYDRINQLLSLGQDRRWRSKMVEWADVGPAGVLCDLCCGTGEVLRHAWERRRNWGGAVGVDFSGEMLAIAEKKCAGIPCSFVRASACDLPLESGFADVVTCAFGFRNLDPRAAGVAEAFRILKPGGSFLVLDILRPPGVVRPAFFLFWLSVTSFLVGHLFRRSAAYAHLRHSVAGLRSVDEVKNCLVGQGFTIERECGWVLGGVRLIQARRPAAGA